MRLFVMWIHNNQDLELHPNFITYYLNITILRFIICISSSSSCISREIKTIVFFIQTFLYISSVAFNSILSKIRISIQFWTKCCCWFHLIHWLWLTCHIIIPWSNTWFYFLLLLALMPLNPFHFTKCALKIIWPRSYVIREINWILL